MKPKAKLNVALPQLFPALLAAFIAFSSICLADTKTYIRIRNLSEFDFKDIIVDGFGGRKNYQDLKSGESSRYQVFEKGVYGSAYVETTIGTNLIKYQPFDSVGESPVRPGKFTYGLAVWTNYLPKLEIIRETNTPPDTKIENRGSKNRNSYKGTHPNTRVLNMTELDFTDVTMTGQSIGRVKAGETSSYFDLDIGPYIPNETVVTFKKTLPGRGHENYLWEETHMKFFRSYSKDQNDPIYEGWFTYALNIESNVCLRLVFSRD